MNWILKKFDELTTLELYAAIQLRNEVFVIEQNCIYQDADGKDLIAYHLMGWNENFLVAYTRIIPPSPSEEMPVIGRVVISPKLRRTGLGKGLMKVTIEACQKQFGNTPLKLSAQLYLKNFYTSLDFQQTSVVYLEDGIEHITMIRNISK